MDAVLAQLETFIKKQTPCLARALCTSLVQHSLFRLPGFPVSLFKTYPLSFFWVAGAPLRLISPMGGGSSNEMLIFLQEVLDELAARLGLELAHHGLKHGIIMGNISGKGFSLQSLVFLLLLLLERLLADTASQSALRWHNFL